MTAIIVLCFVTDAICVKMKKFFGDLMFVCIDWCSSDMSNSHAISLTAIFWDFFSF